MLKKNKKFLLSKRIGGYLLGDGAAINSVREKADQIDWSVFSPYIDVNDITSYIDEFESEFDMIRYSKANGVTGLSMDLIEKYKDVINWRVVIKRRQLKKVDLLKFKNQFFMPNYVSNAPIYSYISLYGCDSHFIKMFDTLSFGEKSKIFSIIITHHKLCKKNIISFVEKNIHEDFSYAEELLHNDYINDDLVNKYMNIFFSNEKPRGGGNNLGAFNIHDIDMYLGSFSLKKRIKNKQTIKDLTMFVAEKKGWSKFDWVLISHGFRGRASDLIEKTMHFGLDPIEDDEYFSEIIKKRYADDNFVSELLSQWQLGEKTLEALLDYSEVKKTGDAYFGGIENGGVFSNKKTLYNIVLQYQELSPDLEKKYIEKYIFISK